MLTGNFWFLFFSLLLGVCFYDFIDSNTGFSYIDELIVLYLSFKWIKEGEANKEMRAFLTIALLYLLYGFVQATNVWKAILMDFFIEIKPFMAFYLSYSLKIQLSSHEQKIIRRWCIVLSILFLPIGINNLLGGTWIYELFGHASRYCTTYQIFGIMYIINSNQTHKYLRKGAFIIALSLLGGRAKAFGFFPIYLFLLYFPKILRYRHFVNYKSIVAFVIVLIAVFYVAKDKVLFYFVTGSQSDEMFARPLLFATAWKILLDYPLLGCGLGSYATNASGLYYSPIYYIYGISDSYGLSPDNPQFISDTYFPVLTQFGFVGIFLFILFWKRRFKMANSLRLKGLIFPIYLTLLIAAFFIIEGISDSSFIQNRGVFMMLLWGSYMGQSMSKCLTPPKTYLHERL